MGFFSELKSDLSQAVNTLMPEDKPETEALDDNKAGETSPKPVDLDSMLDRLDDIKLDDDVMYTGIQVQAWGSDADQANPGRYALLNYLKIEYQAPEPGFIALALLLGLAFVRKMR